MATIDDILSAVDSGQKAALDRLFAFLSIPSISAVPAHFPDCERAAEWLVTELGDLGFEAAKRPTTGRPMVVGHIKAARREAPNVLFYGHYDVQPVDPLNLWRNPPFEPKLESGPQGEEIVARGACDDGAGYEQAAASRGDRIGVSVLQRCLTRSSAQQTPRSSGSAGSYSSVTW